MAIAARPKKDTSPVTPVKTEKKITDLINKGGSSTKAKVETDLEDAEKKPIKLLPYLSQLNDIEAVLSQLPKRSRPSRHAYILQAIDEKLQRDKKKLK